MYKIVVNLSDYFSNIPGLISFCVGMLLASVVFFLVIAPLHNYIKYLVVKKCGDDTAINEGFLTMSPLYSFHVVGFISSLTLQLGFAAPVHYDRDKFKRPVLGTILVALTGILTYFACGLVLMFVYSFFRYQGLFGIGSASALPVEAQWYVYLYHALYSTVYFLLINCMYSAMFNLIPIVPLDLGDVLYMFFSTRVSDALRNSEILVSVGLLAVAFFTFGSPDGFISEMSNDFLVSLMGVYNSLFDAIASMFV